VVSLMSRPLYSWYPLDRRRGGPQSRSGRGGEEKNPIIALPGIEPRNNCITDSINDISEDTFAVNMNNHH